MAKEFTGVILYHHPMFTYYRDTFSGGNNELFRALRGAGFGDMIVETVNANNLSAFVREQMEENADALPDWLDGLVSVFEKTTVGVRKAAR